MQLTAENSELQAEMERNVHAKEESDREAARLLDVLDKVRLFPAGFPITQSRELDLTSVG